MPRGKSKKSANESQNSRVESTVQQCLTTIGVTASNFDGCASLSDQFSRIKRAYFAKILVAHPDKGGNPGLYMIEYDVVVKSHRVTPLLI